MKTIGQSIAEGAGCHSAAIGVSTGNETCRLGRVAFVAFGDITLDDDGGGGILRPRRRFANDRCRRYTVITLNYRESFASESALDSQQRVELRTDDRGTVLQGVL